MFSNIVNSLVRKIVPISFVQRRYPLALKMVDKARKTSDDGIILRPNVEIKGLVYKFIQRAYCNVPNQGSHALIERTCMLPNVKEGDRVYYDFVKYLGGFFDPKLPKRFEIICFWNPIDDLGYIKRVIGFPKEKISFSNGRIFINDSILEEPYNTLGTLKDMSPLRIPKYHLFVLADNRNSMYDSRHFGPLHISNIFGIVRKIEQT